MGDSVKLGTVFVTVDKGWRCAAMCAANKLMGRQLGTIQPRKGPPSSLSMPMRSESGDTDLEMVRLFER